MNVFLPVLFQGFIANPNKQLNLVANPESIFTADFIFSRFSLSMALTKSIKSELSNVRRHIYEQNIEASLLKKCMDRILLSASRLHRMKINENIVYSGLGESARIFELNPQCLYIIDTIAKINLASILIIKTFNSNLNPDKIVFLAPLCKRTHRRCRELQSEITCLIRNGIVSELIAFIELAILFFEYLTYYSIIRINIY